MNQTKHNLPRLILLTIGVFLFTWTNPLNFSVAIAKLTEDIAQTSLIPPPSLQDEQPGEMLTSETNTLPPKVKSAVLNDVVKRTSKTVSAMKILEARSQEWSDGCLGLGKPDELCTQAITPGWQIVVTDGMRNWTYRTDNSGNIIRLEQLNSN